MILWLLNFLSENHLLHTVLIWTKTKTKPKTEAGIKKGLTRVQRVPAGLNLLLKGRKRHPLPSQTNLVALCLVL